MKKLDDIETISTKDLRIAELEAEVERLKKLQPNMLVGKLTDAKIRNLKSRGRHNDSPNLYIQVPNAVLENRLWMFGWTAATGKFTQMSLGPYPLVSIDQARQKAQHYRLLLRQKKDPKEEKNSEHTAIQLASGLIKTVKEVGLEWLKIKIKPKHEHYARKIENQLNKYIFSTIGDMLINQVAEKIIVDSGPGHVGLTQLHFEMWPTGHDIHMYLNRIFNFGIRKHYCDRNPAAPAVLEDLLPDRDDVYQRKQQPSLPLDEQYDFRQKLRAYEDRSPRKTGHTTIALVCEYQMYCAVRISEVLQAQWSEIDRATKTWNVPWQHRKKGKSKRIKRPTRPVPITKGMQAVLDEMERRHPNHSDDDLIFPSDKTGRKYNCSIPVSLIKRIDPRIGTHGFRTNLRDWRTPP
jgi:integrase